MPRAMRVNRLVSESRRLTDGISSMPAAPAEPTRRRISRFRVRRCLEIALEHDPLKVLVIALDAVFAIDGLKLFRHLPCHAEEPDLRTNGLVFNRLSDGKLKRHSLCLAVRPSGKEALNPCHHRRMRLGAPSLWAVAGSLTDWPAALVANEGDDLRDVFVRAISRFNIVKTLRQRALAEKQQTICRANVADGVGRELSSPHSYDIDSAQPRKGFGDKPERNDVLAHARCAADHGMGETELTLGAYRPQVEGNRRRRRSFMMFAQEASVPCNRRR